jgi:transposase
MQVRVHLRLIRVLAVLVDTIDVLVVSVASTKSWSRCPHCGFRCRDVHDTRIRKIRDLPVSGRPVTLVWSRRRFSCGNCGQRHLKIHDEFEGRLTRRFARALVADARVMSIRAVTRRHGVGWTTVMALVADWSQLVGAHRRAKRCRVLLVDETSMRRRHRYVTVLQNGETGELLAMVPHRNEAALSSFFAAQGRRWCQGVKVVISDGSTAYQAAIDRHLGHARHALDRFHALRWFAAGLTLVRRNTQRREPAGQVTPVFDPELFRARFALLRRADTLSDADRARLDQLFAHHPHLAAGQASNGRLDRTNNKLQVLRRVAYGFTNHANLETRGTLACPATRSSPPTPATLTMNPRSLKIFPNDAAAHRYPPQPPWQRSARHATPSRLSPPSSSRPAEHTRKHAHPTPRVCRTRAIQLPHRRLRSSSGGGPSVRAVCRTHSPIVRRRATGPRNTGTRHRDPAQEGRGGVVHGTGDS